MNEQYSVQSIVRGAATVFNLQQKDVAHAEIVPEWGNNCFVFRREQEVLEPVSFEAFSQRPHSFGIPILFPFPNRIRDGRFTFQDKHYVVNPKQHGFVRDKKWTVVDYGASESEGAWLRSRMDASDYPKEILEQFPHPFQLDIVYRLHDARLIMETKVRNTGTSVFPFGFGIHPYFRLPERGTVQVPAAKRWELVAAIPTGKLLDVADQYDLRQPRDVHSLSLDDIFTDLQADDDGKTRCTLNDESNGETTIVEFDRKQFPHVVVYNVPSPRRAICIEPYTCPSDAFNLQNRGVNADVLTLLPQNEMRLNLSIYTRT